MSFTINEESFEQFKKKYHIKWLTDEKNLHIFLVVMELSWNSVDEN
jgi:hypothetical protein